MGVMVVTGGAGFIGSNFVRHVVARTDDRVVVLDKLTYAGHRENLAGLGPDRVELVEADIAEPGAVTAVMDRCRPDAVVNFAAESHVDRSIDSPRPFVDTNIVGTFVLLEAARARLAAASEAERRSFRFLHVSTDEVFGSLGDDGRFDETTPYAPRSPYAASKAAADHLARAWHHTFDVPVVLTNCSNNYGPYQFPEKLVPLMILNALEGRPLPIYGTGGNVRDWLYVEDHCEAILLALRRAEPGAGYTIGGDAERTNVQVVDAICAALERVRPAARNDRVEGSYIDLKTFVPDRTGHDWRYAIDAARIRSELGWAPRHDFDAGIEATVRWYLEHREWCDAVQRRGAYGRERLGLGGGTTGGGASE